jgi:hypothetical protein
MTERFFLANEEVWRNKEIPRLIDGINFSPMLEYIRMIFLIATVGHAEGKKLPSLSSLQKRRTRIDKAHQGDAGLIDMGTSGTM